MPRLGELANDPVASFFLKAAAAAWTPPPMNFKGVKAMAATAIAEKLVGTDEELIAGFPEFAKQIDAFKTRLQHKKNKDIATWLNKALQSRVNAIQPKNVEAANKGFAKHKIFGQVFPGVSSTLKRKAQKVDYQRKLDAMRKRQAASNRLGAARRKARARAEAQLKAKEQAKLKASKGVAPAGTAPAEKTTAPAAPTTTTPVATKAAPPAAPKTVAGTPAKTPAPAPAKTTDPAQTTEAPAKTTAPAKIPAPEKQVFTELFSALKPDHALKMLPTLPSLIANMRPEQLQQLSTELPQLRAMIHKIGGGNPQFMKGMLAQVPKLMESLGAAFDKAGITRPPIMEDDWSQPPAPEEAAVADGTKKRTETVRNEAKAKTEAEAGAGGDAAAGGAAAAAGGLGAMVTAFLGNFQGVLQQIASSDVGKALLGALGNAIGMPDLAKMVVQESVEKPVDPATARAERPEALDRGEGDTSVREGLSTESAAADSFGGARAIEKGVNAIDRFGNQYYVHEDGRTYMRSTNPDTGEVQWTYNERLSPARLSEEDRAGRIEAWTKYERQKFLGSSKYRRAYERNPTQAGEMLKAEEAKFAKRAEERVRRETSAPADVKKMGLRTWDINDPNQPSHFVINPDQLGTGVPEGAGLKRVGPNGALQNANTVSWTAHDRANKMQAYERASLREGLADAKTRREKRQRDPSFAAKTMLGYQMSGVPEDRWPAWLQAARKNPEMASEMDAVASVMRLERDSSMEGVPFNREEALATARAKARAKHGLPAQKTPEELAAEEEKKTQDPIYGKEERDPETGELTEAQIAKERRIDERIKRDNKAKEEAALKRDAEVAARRKAEYDKQDAADAEAHKKWVAQQKAKQQPTPAPQVAERKPTPAPAPTEQQPATAPKVTERRPVQPTPVQNRPMPPKPKSTAEQLAETAANPAAQTKAKTTGTAATGAPGAAAAATPKKTTPPTGQPPKLIGDPNAVAKTKTKKPGQPKLNSAKLGALLLEVASNPPEAELARAHEGQKVAHLVEVVGDKRMAKIAARLGGPGPRKFRRSKVNKPRRPTSPLGSKRFDPSKNIGRTGIGMFHDPWKYTSMTKTENQPSWFNSGSVRPRLRTPNYTQPGLGALAGGLGSTSTIDLYGKGAFGRHLDRPAKMSFGNLFGG